MQPSAGPVVLEAAHKFIIVVWGHFAALQERTQLHVANRKKVCALKLKSYLSNANISNFRIYKGLSYI